MSVASSLEGRCAKYADGVERLLSPSLNKTQRFDMSDEKEDQLNNLALGAKLEKALGRRLSLQDAVFTKKPTTPTYLAPPIKRAGSVVTLINEKATY